MIYENNQINVTGTILHDLEYSHEAYGEKFFSTKLCTTRESGAIDIIPLIVSERILNSNITNEAVEITGTIRTFNKKDEYSNYLKISVFVDTITILDIEAGNDSWEQNDVVLTGYICKKQSLRDTPLGRKICDVILAVNRHNNKSDYIPCIFWGKNAKYISTFNIGDKINVRGRLQSRTYRKNDEEKVAYEVSINRLEIPNRD